MSDLIDDPADGLNSPEYTVTEISGAVKRVIEGEFGHVRIRGEVGRVSRPRSGHVYLDLKDDRSVISGVMWKGVADKLATQPEEGMEVVATGKITTFPGQSKYQIVIENIAPAGMGALMAMLEKRKTALAAEGLFEESRKKPLPFLPEVIGVVTSPSGAVIRDILHRLRDRFPRKVLIWPVAVQGAKCAPEVANAIRGFNAMTKGGALPRPDLLIVARGGGSIEDLWGFNEEIVARAAAASDIPLISAVGHETDTTLIDFASDRRAPTPTAAAEIAVPVRLELLAWVDQADGRMTRGMAQGIAQRQQRLRDLARVLPKPLTLVANARQSLDFLGERLRPALQSAAQQKRVHLVEIAGTLRPSILRRAISDKERNIRELDRRIAPALARAVREKRSGYLHVAGRLRVQALQQDVGRKRQDLNRLAARLSEVSQSRVSELQTRLTALERMRQTLGYTATLKRGYAVVRGDGEVVTTKVMAEKASVLEIEFHDAKLTVGHKPARKSKTAATPPTQGDLF